MPIKNYRTQRRLVAFGFLGTALDEGEGVERWKKWRPSVALCQQGELPIRRFELFYEEKFEKLAGRVAGDISRISPGTNVKKVLIRLDDPWDFEEVFGLLYDFARQYTFDTQREEYLVHVTTGTHAAQVCMFLLVESHHFPAKLVQTIPPSVPGEDAAGGVRIIDLDLSRYDCMASRFRQEAKEGQALLKSGIKTMNRSFNRMVERIEYVAVNSKSSILLFGPTGSGKTLIAKRIYELKRARHLLSGDFVEVNCATIRGDAAMSALFGHVKGAYTGAVADRNGLLRSADGGLLLLDEIGELGPDEQAMLLRALEEKRFRPVGCDREVASDFQLIGATSRDLEAAAAGGRFREDLLARIKLWTFRLPSLRERLEDIEPNIDHELDLYCQSTGEHVTFSRETKRRFLDFAVSPEALWSANFRDLNASVTRMATLAMGGRITLPVVEEEIGRLKALWAHRDLQKEEDDDILASFLGVGKLGGIDPFDRIQLSYVMRVCREARSLSDAGRILYSVSRRRRKNVNDADRLRKYLARFGMSWEKLRS